MEEDSLGIVGTTIGDKYAVEEVVGQGAFAIVYRATHLIWQRPVALKCFRGLSHLGPEAERRLVSDFIEEGALLSELSARNATIVQARDVGMLMTPTGEELPYIVLEWLEGRTLEAILADQRCRGGVGFSMATALSVLSPVAAALDLAHRSGVAHRDIKPGNILVGGDLGSQNMRIKLLDFGIAKIASGALSLEFGSTAGVISSFTPGYAAPEQFTRKLGATGPWTDVYSLALVLVELLLGRPPMMGDDVIELGMAAVDYCHRPTPRSLGVQIPKQIEIVLARALEVNPEARFANAGEFWLALHQAQRASIRPSLEIVVDDDDQLPSEFLDRAHVPKANAKELGSGGSGGRRSGGSGGRRSGGRRRRSIRPRRVRHGPLGASAVAIALAIVAGAVAGIGLFAAVPSVGRWVWPAFGHGDGGWAERLLWFPGSGEMSGGGVVRR